MCTIEDILGPRTDPSTFLLHLKKDVRSILACYRLPKTA